MVPSVVPVGFTTDRVFICCTSTNVYRYRHRKWQRRKNRTRRKLFPARRPDRPSRVRVVPMHVAPHTKSESSRPDARSAFNRTRSSRRRSHRKVVIHILVQGDDAVFNAAYTHPSNAHACTADDCHRATDIVRHCRVDENMCVKVDHV